VAPVARAQGRVGPSAGPSSSHRPCPGGPTAVRSTCRAEGPKAESATCPAATDLGQAVGRRPSHPTLQYVDPHGRRRQPWGTNLRTNRFEPVKKVTIAPDRLLDQPTPRSVRERPGRLLLLRVGLAVCRLPCGGMIAPQIRTVAGALVSSTSHVRNASTSG
jgi:hypothetical protein